MRCRMRPVTREENDDFNSPFGVSIAQAIFNSGDFDEDIDRANRRFKRRRVKRW